MTRVVPNTFVFQVEFTLPHRKRMPGITGALSDWGDAELLPDFGSLDGGRRFADVWSCWGPEGLAIAYRVRGRRKPLRCEPKRFWQGDNLRLCLDMRDARGNKRATRFCQQFFFLPAGGGRSGKSAVAGVNPIARAREAAPAVPAGRIAVASRVESDAYALEALIPADCLSGFDPDAHPRIGFYSLVEDVELGQQPLTVGDELNWHIDPSTWATAVLDS